MAILVATHIKTGHERSLPLSDGALLVGRTTGEDGPGKFAIDFDPALSRRHFTAFWDGNRLRIQRDPAAKQPLYFGGQPQDEFTVFPGQQFGCAQTRFHLKSDGPKRNRLGDDPLRTFTLPKQGLEFFQQRDTLRPLQALLKLQPLLSSAREPKIFFQDLLPLLADMVPAADEVMALTFNSQGEYDVIARWGGANKEPNEPTPPSRTLLKQALLAGEPVVHLFAEEPETGGNHPTMHAGVLWALAAPIETGEEAAYAIYAIGAESMKKVVSTVAETPGDLDRAVLGLVAGVVGNYLREQRLHRLEGQMGNFFSPGLRDILIKDPQASLLELGRHEVTTLFFDLRGFSKATEQAMSDEADEERWEKFLKHFEALKRIMTKVTESVFETDGIVVDYQGDAVFACWGAPLNLEDHARRAIQTAQATMRRLAEEREVRSDDSGTHLPCGIGIASGEVLAGNVGVAGQIHYEIIGRCANVASRLEGLTKYFQVPVLLTLETRRSLPADILCRRVARVRPAGMNLPVDVFELVMAQDLGGSGLDVDDVGQYEEALLAFEAGRMMEAERILRGVPLEDPVRRFLQSQVGQILLDGLPSGWDGVINFKRK